MCRDSCSCKKPKVWKSEGPALREHLDLRADGTILLMVYEPVQVVVVDDGTGQFVAHASPLAMCSAYLVLCTPEMDRLVLNSLKQDGALGKALRRFAGQRKGLSKSDPRVGPDATLSRLPVDGTLQGIFHQIDGIDGNDEEHPEGTGLVGDVVFARTQQCAVSVSRDRDSQVVDHICQETRERQLNGAAAAAVAAASTSTEPLLLLLLLLPSSEFHEATEKDQSASVTNDSGDQKMEAAIQAHAQLCRRVVALSAQVTVTAANTSASSSSSSSAMNPQGKDPRVPPPVNKFVHVSADELADALAKHTLTVQGLDAGSLLLPAAAAASEHASKQSHPLFSPGYNRWG